MKLLQRLRDGARRLKRDALTLWFACRHPGTPWTARLLAALAVGYALSPIDLIPDFIPVLGYLDDVVLLPALIWLALRLLPPEVQAECRAQAQARMEAQAGRPRSVVGAVVIAAIWLALAASLGCWLWGRFGGGGGPGIG